MTNPHRRVQTAVGPVPAHDTGGEASVDLLCGPLDCHWGKSGFGQVTAAVSCQLEVFRTEPCLPQLITCDLPGPRYPHYHATAAQTPFFRNCHKYRTDRLDRRGDGSPCRCKARVSASAAWPRARR